MPGAALPPGQEAWIVPLASLMVTRWWHSVIAALAGIIFLFLPLLVHQKLKLCQIQKQMLVVFRPAMRPKKGIWAPKAGLPRVWVSLTTNMGCQRPMTPT